MKYWNINIFDRNNKFLNNIDIYLYYYIVNLYELFILINIVI
jgi:hypothetical protein